MLYHKGPARSTCLNAGEYLDSGLPMTEHYYFGATRATLFLNHEVLAVPISRIRCSRCVTGPRLEYITWANSNAAEDEKREAAALLAILVEWDHPQHGPWVTVA